MTLNIDLKDRHARMSALTTWVDHFWTKTAVKEYTKYQAEIMIFMSMTDTTFEAATRQHGAIRAGEFGLLPQIAGLRADYLGLRISDPALMCVAALSDSRGTVVMWLYALRHAQAVEPLEDLISAQRFQHSLLNGWASNEELSELWDAQKLESGENLLDHIVVDTDFCYKDDEEVPI